MFKKIAEKKASVISLIVLIHLFAAYLMISPHLDTRKKFVCIENKNDQNIQYFVLSDKIYSINDKKLLNIDLSKPYIQEEYLNKHFLRVACPDKIEDFEKIEDANIVDSLRIWRMEQDSKLLD